MKGLITFLLIFYSLVTFSQTSIFTENCGIPATTTLITAYTGWQNNNTLIFSGNGDVRTTTASTGYTGASGNGNVFITNTVGQNFVISNINTINYINLTLSVGVFKSTTASNGSELKIEVSTDGTTYTALTYTLPTGTGTAIWRLVTPTGTIPATTNLRIRFRNTSTTPQFRIDDIKLLGDYVAPLPIELIQFGGSIVSNGIQLCWSTASEYNSDKIEIHKLIDDEWIKIGEVKSAGFSVTRINYTFIDTNLINGYNYYRLNQVDFDDKHEYSSIIAVKVNDISEDKIRYYDILGQEVDSTSLISNQMYIKISGGKAKKFLYVQ